MTPMFCTVQEAAEVLQTSEEQISALLEQGILREFRQGPHRLLRRADIGALDLKRTPPAEAALTVTPAVQDQRTSLRPGKPKPSRHVRRQGGHGPAPDRAPCRRRCEWARGRTRQAEPPPTGVTRSSLRLSASAPAALSLRQWFWMGLVQDRPAAIALLAGLVLLGGSALVAGICLLAG